MTVQCSQYLTGDPFYACTCISVQSLNVYDEMIKNRTLISPQVPNRRYGAPRKNVFAAATFIILVGFGATANNSI